jgi:benzil reductase ((S)-benzoin forming)
MRTGTGSMAAMTATVITGVSRGLGAALFDGLDARGHRILALGRTFSGAQRLLAGDAPDRVRLRTTDLADLPALPDRAELAAFLGDEPAVLVHNAGVVEPIGAVGTLDPAAVTAAVAVNLTAPVLLTNAFLAAATGRPAHVLFVSSGAAARPTGGWASYCAGKAGGEMFVRATALQYADDPAVHVESVNPGVMDTAMQAVLRAQTDTYFPRRDHFVALHDRGELPAPADVARRILTEYLGEDRGSR